MASVSSHGPVQSLNSTRDEVQKHKTREHLAEVAHIGAGAFALYEHHQMKKDPAHVEKHQKGKKIAGATALGLAGYAFYEHHEAHKLEALLSHDGKQEKKDHRSSK